MKIHHIFAAFIVIGIFGRWIVIPSVKRVKLEKEYQAKKDAKEAQASCFDKGHCSLYDLMRGPELVGEFRPLSVKYLHKNWEELLKENSYLAWKLRGMLIGDEDNKALFIKSLKELDSRHQKAFLSGLYSCHERACQSFYAKNMELWKDDKIYFEEVSRLDLKQPGHWGKKNKILKSLLVNYEEREEYARAIELLEFIPNHPQLKKFVEKFYLKIIGQRNIDNAAVHLARYNNGWADRQFKTILESDVPAHKDAFLGVLKISCPQKLNQIYSYWSQWNNNTRKIALNEARYLLKDNEKLREKIGLKKTSLVLGSKCHSSLSSRESAF